MTKSINYEGEKEVMSKNEETILKTLPEVTKKNVGSIAYLVFLESHKVSNEAKFIWFHLDCRAGTNRYLWFGKEKIHNTLRMSKDTYGKYVEELERVGGVIQYRRYDKENGSRKTNVILVCEYNQLEDTFIVPANIKEIEKAIKEAFPDDKITRNTLKEKVKKEGKPKKSHGGKPKKSHGVKQEKQEGGKPKISVYPRRKFRITLGENLASNIYKVLIKKNSNKEKERIGDSIPSIPKNESEKLWNEFNILIKNVVGENIYKIHFGVLKFIEIKDNVMYAEAPTNFTKDLIEVRYEKEIKKILEVYKIFHLAINVANCEEI